MGETFAQPFGTVRGLVTGAADRPLAGATVEALGSRWRAISGPDGRFTIRLPDGAWRLRVSRIGYRPDTSLIAIAASDSAFTVTIRLIATPVALAGITVETAAAPPMAHSVTTETVRQVPPLAEPDVFRAVVLLPVVSQPNDLKGRIHLAGGASDETGVAIDDHPLQDPFHLLGVLGAFNVAALERADVLIHHLPASVGGRLSGLIDLQTRRPTATPSREGVASLLSSSATVSDGRMPLGLDVLASVRVTYLDKLVLLIAPDARIAGDELPLLGYRDGILRLGRAFGAGWRAEVLGFSTRDVIGVTQEARASGDRPLRWGESLAGLRLIRAGTAWETVLRASFNRAMVRLDPSSQEPNFVRSRRDWSSAGVEAVWRAARWQATVGAAADRRRHWNAWRTSGIAQDIFSPNTPDEYIGEAAQTEAAVFAEVSRDVARGAAMTIGVRGVGASGGRYIGPRALVSYQVRGQRVEVALGRRHQFLAELEEPIEGNVMPPTFLLGTPRVADVAALAMERPAIGLPLGGIASLRVEAFHKRYRARPILRDRAEADSFPDFARVDGRSSGAALSGRATWLSGTLVQGSYTYQLARELVAGSAFPTAWDAPHDVSVFASVPARRGWSLTGAYRGHSGRATTPVEARVFVPNPELRTSLGSRFLRGQRNSARVPAYHRVDVGGRRAWRARGVDWTLFAQVLNVLNHRNAIDYGWEEFVPAKAGGSRPATARGGLPVLPTLGLEARW